MRNFVLIFLIAAFNTTVFSQINETDSTVQVIGYWDIADKQTYNINSLSYKITNGTDTTDVENYIYKVNVEVIDSTENSYTIRWDYTDYQVLASSNPIIKSVLDASISVPIIIQTDEMGAFEQVLNTTEIMTTVQQILDSMVVKFSDDSIVTKAFQSFRGMYNNENTIESSIEDIKQFYMFHGVKYKLEEDLSGSYKAKSLFGDGVIDVDFTYELDEINPEEDNSVLRSWTTYNSNQLTDASYNFLKKMTESMQLPFPLSREEMPQAMSETRIASRVHGSTGWPIYSVETKETSVNNILQINERIIELE